MSNKKKILILILLVFSMNGCASSIEAQPTFEDEHEVSNTSKLSEISQILLDFNNELFCDAFAITKTHKSEKNEDHGSYININYPQMSGYVENEKELIINEMLYRMVKELSSSTDINHNYNEYLDIDYSATLADANIISVCYLGMYGYKGKATHFARTITFEVKSLKILELEDITSINAMEDSIINMKYLSSRGDLDFLFRDNNDILSLFRESFVEGERYVDNFYVKENAIGIVIGIPPAGGDYLMLEFKNEQVH